MLRQTEAVYGSLNSAGNWGTWDVLGGGLLTDMMKYSRLDDAQRGMEQLQSALRRYRAELADVDRPPHRGIPAGGVLHGAGCVF